MGDDKLKNNFLKNHLNVWWLRPESALFDAISSTVISQCEMVPPSIDLGCGNGIFSFITAGGSFSLDFDWFINVDFSKQDIYNASKKTRVSKYIKKKPKQKFDWGVDIKPNLLNIAKDLNFYKNLKVWDLNKRFPFEEESFKTVFSNILYWLKNPEVVLKEIYRILMKRGKAILCLPNENFYKFCPSYRWKEFKNPLERELMRTLNLDRGQHILHYFTYRKFSLMANKIGFSKVKVISYLSPLTLRVWDVGLRSLSRPLIRMVNKLNPRERRRIKSEWMDTCMKYLRLLYEMDFRYRGKRGFYLFMLQK